MSGTTTPESRVIEAVLCNSGSTRLVIDPNFFVDFDAIREYLEHLNTLSDLIRGAHIRVDIEVNRIQTTLKEMWEQNTDLRKRGLRGGRARKQNKMGKSFAAMKDMTTEQTKRRKQVEAKDYQGRTRSEGLKEILTLLETSHQFIQEKQTFAEEVLTAGRKVARGDANPIETCIAHAADQILNADHEELGDIEEMLRVFFDEYSL